MENNKALVWIRDDFRVNHNSALAYASENHEQVSTVYIFNPEDYENKREAQRWWIYPVSYTHLTLPTILLV